MSYLNVPRLAGLGRMPLLPEGFGVTHLNPGNTSATFHPHPSQARTDADSLDQKPISTGTKLAVAGGAAAALFLFMNQ